MVPVLPRVWYRQVDRRHLTHKELVQKGFTSFFGKLTAFCTSVDTKRTSKHKGKPTNLEIHILGPDVTNYPYRGPLLNDRPPKYERF